MEYKEIYKCEPFRVWVQSDSTVGMKMGSTGTLTMSADIAAVLGAVLIEAAAHVAKQTTTCLELATKNVAKDKDTIKKAAEVADRFAKLE